jgi:hypothetical protein
LKVVLAVIGGVVEKDAPDRDGIMRGAPQAQNGAPERDRPFEVRLTPDLDRIAPKGQND